MFNILSHKGNADQKNSELPFYPREQTTTNVGKDMGRKELLYMLVGM
jgi:hypothetical protein